MKLYALILSFLISISLGSCRDMNTRDSTPMQDGTPGQTSTDNTTANRDRGITNTGKMEKDRSNPTMNSNTDNTQNRALTSNQRQDLYRNLDLTDEQNRRLEELRENRSGDDMSQMDRDFKSVLDDNQYNRYERWKRDNL